MKKSIATIVIFAAALFLAACGEKGKADAASVIYSEADNSKVRAESAEVTFAYNNMKVDVAAKYKGSSVTSLGGPDRPFEVSLVGLVEAMQKDGLDFTKLDDNMSVEERLALKATSQIEEVAVWINLPDSLTEFYGVDTDTQILLTVHNDRNLLVHVYLFPYYTISDKNAYFEAKDGVLYDKKTGQILQHSRWGDYQPVNRLTLDEALEIAKKGDEIAYEDFEDYDYLVWTSGMDFRDYWIDDVFSVSFDVIHSMTEGEKINEKYGVRLGAAFQGDGISLAEGYDKVKEFIDKYKR